jgi:hypothetical protein
MDISNPFRLSLDDLAVESFVVSTDMSSGDEEESSKVNTQPAGTCHATCQVGTGIRMCAGCN